MDPNPARNRKLTPVADPTEEAPQKAPESAPEVPTKKVAPTPTYQVPTLNYPSYSYAAVTANTTGYIGQFTMSVTNGGYVDWQVAHLQDANGMSADRFTVNITAYAVVNGELFHYNMPVARDIWEMSPPEGRDRLTKLAKRELGRIIADRIAKVFVEGKVWVSQPEPAEQTT